MNRTALTGTRPLLKVSLHQDARNIAPWVMLISVLSASSILAYLWIFPDDADRAALAGSLGVNPALSLVFGRARDLMTADGFNAWRAGQLGALFAGLMAILLVVRNSRAHEDSGQAELIASGVLARQSRLAVAVLMGVVASLALGVVSWLLTVLCGGGLMATAVLSGTFTASGLVFTAVAALSSQLGADSRSATSLAVGTLGVLYLLRGWLDFSGAPEWTVWLTPFGWLERTRPSTEDNPWPLLVAVAFAVAVGAVALALHALRDFGQGAVATRPGPSHARLAGSVWGLVWRMHRGALIGWSVAFLGLGVVFGSLVTSVGDVVGDNPALRALLGAQAVDVDELLGLLFLATVLQLIAIITAVMGVQFVMALWVEERDHRVEPLLAGSLRRSTLLAAHLAVALVATTGALLLAGLGMGVVVRRSDLGVQMSEVVAQAAVTVPAVWVLVALAAAAVGAFPEKRLIGWLGVVATFGLTLLGPTFKLWDWALDISPLRHVPHVLAPETDWTGFLGLLAVAALLVTVAFVGYRRRDVS